MEYVLLKQAFIHITYERRNLPMSLTDYLLSIRPACLHQHKRVLVRETTPYICFMIYFAEIKLFQMYNSNSNAESKIRKKKKLINNKSLNKNPHNYYIVIVKLFWKLFEITLYIQLFTISINNYSHFHFAISQNLAFFSLKTIDKNFINWYENAKYILLIYFNLQCMYMFQDFCHYRH